MEEECEIPNHPVDNDGRGTAILYKLQSIARQRFEKVDYQQQIEQWNKYQELLDEIDKKCGRDVGVRLVRSIRHNFKQFTDISYVAVAVIAVIDLLLLLAVVWFAGIYVLGCLAATGLVVWQSFIRLRHPAVIRFRCSPVLHVDDFAYMCQTIRGIPLAHHDPVIRLPVLRISISRAWLAQHLFHKVILIRSSFNIREPSIIRVLFPLIVAVEWKQTGLIFLTSPSYGRRT